MKIKLFTSSILRWRSLLNDHISQSSSLLVSLRINLIVFFFVCSDSLFDRWLWSLAWIAHSMMLVGSFSIVTWVTISNLILYKYRRLINKQLRLEWRNCIRLGTIQFQWWAQWLCRCRHCWKNREDQIKLLISVNRIWRRRAAQQK